jgi:hypothetical protein
VTAARTRIGRVIMKAGGADVRVLRRDPEKSPHIAEHIRRHFIGLLNRERAPDAYASVAFWFDPETPGRPGYSATFCTVHDAISAPILVRMAGSYLIAEHAAHVGAYNAIEAMGYETDDWTPDDAA